MRPRAGVKKGGGGGVNPGRWRRMAMGECVRVRYLSALALAAEACRGAALAMLRPRGGGGGGKRKALS